MNIKVGDRVEIKEDSRYYGDGDFNPSDCMGTVISISDLHHWLNIRVKWDNGTTNSYTTDDLKVVPPSISDRLKQVYELLESIEEELRE